MEFEKQFDEKMKEIILCDCPDCTWDERQGAKINDLNLLFRSLLSQSIEEERKRIEGIIEGKKGECSTGINSVFCSCGNCSFNIFLDDLLAEIKK